MDNILGYVIGETTNTELTFLSSSIPEIGSYTLIEYGNKKIIGMVESVTQGSLIFNEVLNVKDLIKIKNIENNDSYYIVGKIKILGDLEKKEIPRTPPKPGTEIYYADDESLKHMFSNGHLKIGKLISKNVPVCLDVNKLCSRHLAILAITGMGKSNTVSVILSELNKLKGTVVVFDVHGEYKTIKSNDENNKLRINIVEPKLNIFNISTSDFCDLANIDPQATKQRPYVRRAIKKVKENKKEVDFNNCEEYVNEIIGILDEYIDSSSKDKDSIETAIFRLEDMLQFKGHIIKLHYNPIKEIKEGHINIVSLEELDEGDMDIIISYISKNILQNRKEAFRNNEPKPVFLIFEEAHLIVPQNRNTKSKYYISRIAREGRKFGVGICLVSQRPKTLDQESLSQCNNLIISKLIEPSDQSHVQHASENLSEDLLKQLPSLNIGEAVIIGPSLKIPAIVKIDKFNGEYKGEDIPIVDIWGENKGHTENDEGIIPKYDEGL